MLPYFDPPALGPVTPFGVLVVGGLLLGAATAFRHAERLGLDLERAQRLATWCGVCGLLGAHLFDLLLYQPGWADKDGALWTLLNPFAGISSYGGLLGGTLGFVVFAHRSGINKLRYAEPAIFGGLVLLTFGRAGCASVHDHIGVASDFTLAVDFLANNPAGIVGPHHDLGLYEFAYLLLLLAVVALLLRKPRRPGWLLGFVTISYAIPRFFADFLRRTASDPRYFALTPAQWISIATMVAGLVVLARVYTRREPAPERYDKPTPWRSYLTDFLRFRTSPHRT